MANLIKYKHNKDTHLVNVANRTTLCDLDFPNQTDTSREPVEEGAVLTCKDCAEIALGAIAGTTKAERRDWRKL